MNHSNAIVHFCEEVLNEKTCHILARKYKFIERSTSKLKGHEFIKAMIIPSKGLSTDSLQGICKRIKGFNSAADLSAQALCERINDVSSKELMKNVLATILCYMHTKIIDNCPKLDKILGHFTSILLEDSTVAKLNKKLQEEFIGTNRGGTGAKSQVKIDLIYNLTKGTLVDTQIYSGKVPDQGLASRIIKYVQVGDLVIRDLGYFVLKSLKAIAELGAYFLSRFLSNIKVYLKKDDLQPVDLGKYVEKYYPRSVIIDLEEVFLGDEKISSRLILYRQPKEIIKEKLREANKRAKATGRKMSCGKKLCLQFAIFVTNVPKGLLAAEIVGTVYRLRWEIELIFKRWKSQLEIDYLKGINENRIECLIWSRLCSVVIIEVVGGYISRIAQKAFSGREISHVKLIEYILRESEFCRAVANNRVEKFLIEMEKDILRMLLKDSRKRKTMRDRVFTGEWYYDMQPSNNQMVT
jgi:hypothetical protein